MVHIHERNVGGDGLDFSKTKLYLGTHSVHFRMIVLGEEFFYRKMICFVLGGGLSL